MGTWVAVQTGALIHSCVQINTSIYLLWKSGWRCLKKIKSRITIWSSISLWACTQRTRHQGDIYAAMFIAVLIIIARKGNQPSPTRDEWIMKICCVCKTHYIQPWKKWNHKIFREINGLRYDVSWGHSISERNILRNLPPSRSEPTTFIGIRANKCLHRCSVTFGKENKTW